MNPIIEIIISKNIGKMGHSNIIAAMKITKFNSKITSLLLEIILLFLFLNSFILLKSMADLISSKFITSLLKFKTFYYNTPQIQTRDNSNIGTILL